MSGMAQEFLDLLMKDPDFKKSLAASMLHRLKDDLGQEIKKQMLGEMKSDLQAWKGEYIRSVKSNIETEIAHWVGGHLKREVESNKNSVLSFVKNLADDDETKRLISKAFESILYRALKDNDGDIKFKVALDLKELCPTGHPDPYDV